MTNNSIEKNNSGRARIAPSRLLYGNETNNQVRVHKKSKAFLLYGDYVATTACLGVSKNVRLEFSSNLWYQNKMWWDLQTSYFAIVIRTCTSLITGEQLQHKVQKSGVKTRIDIFYRNNKINFKRQFNK